MMLEREKAVEELFFLSPPLNRQQGRKIQGEKSPKTTTKSKKGIVVYNSLVITHPSYRTYKKSWFSH